MTPEIAAMEPDEVKDWYKAKKTLAFTALQLGMIDNDVFLSLVEKITEDYCDWIVARINALVEEHSHDIR